MATIVTRAGKGSPLTNTELDANFTNLNTEKADIASPAFTGNATATTQVVDNNTTRVATTAFVIAQASAVNPSMNGTVAIGTSLRFARADHVHASDTSRAPIASPTFTGTVTIPSGASIAGYATLASPTFTGTVTIPSGASIAGYAPIASPSFTGTPVAPTAAVNTNTTQLATTAFVVGQAGSANPLMNGTLAVGSSLAFSRQDHVHPSDTTRAPINAPSFTTSLTVAGKAVTTPISISYAASLTIDSSLSNMFYIGTLTGNVTTVTLSSPTDGQALNVLFTNDGTAGRTVTLPGTWKITGTYNTAANARNLLVGFYFSSGPFVIGSWNQVAA